MNETEERRRLIDEYRNGPAMIEEALSGITEEELDRAVDGWTPRQIVHHVADSETTAAIRLRRLVAEDRPLIAGYDQELFARRLHYSERPIEPSLEAVRGARSSTAGLLEVLTEEDWSREGTHSEVGPYSVMTWLRIYAAHCRDHADQIRRARRP